MQIDPLDIGLFAIVLIVLVGPFLSKKIEHNLEVFLFIMGVLAVTISSFYSKEALEALGYTEQQMELIGWNMEIVMEAIKEPIYKGIVPMVLIGRCIIPLRAGPCPDGHEFDRQKSSYQDCSVPVGLHLGIVFQHNNGHHCLSPTG